jgi:hypothetical protein
MSGDEALIRVNIHDRDFQKYSVDRRIYCVPVDEVSRRCVLLWFQLRTSVYMLMKKSARKIDSRLNTT